MRTYPYTGTCDACAAGPVPLREADPVTQAWVCQPCDDVEDRAILAAAAAMAAHAPSHPATWPDLARVAIAAYHDAHTSADPDHG